MGTRPNLPKLHPIGGVRAHIRPGAQWLVTCQPCSLTTTRTSAYRTWRATVYTDPRTQSTWTTAPQRGTTPATGTLPIPWCAIPG